ncbi:MAG: hypothetical protein WCA22_08960 [Candidatus Binatus sp.]
MMKNHTFAEGLYIGFAAGWFLTTLMYGFAYHIWPALDSIWQ